MTVDELIYIQTINYLKEAAYIPVNRWPLFESLKNNIQLNIQNGGMHKSSLKFHRREVTRKLRKGEKSFLYATHSLNLIHIAIQFLKIFHMVSYLWYAQGKSEISSKGSNSEIEKGRAIFFVCDTPS